MKIVDWTLPAQMDLAGIDDKFADIDPDYADRVGLAATQAARFLAERPAAGPMIDNTTHKCPVKRTPYLLLYRCLGNRLEILRVRHNRENWRKGP